MNSERKFHNLTVLLGMAFVLIVGTCFPSPVPQTAFAAENDGDSGGFVVFTERVEGAIDIGAILGGRVEISEGVIEGLTITKRLENTSEGPLVIKISSPGPIPVEDLKGDTVGLPELGGLCFSDTFGWLCLENTTMTLTEQTAKSIALPNATVETCFEDECEDGGQRAGAMSEGKDKEKSVEEILEMIDGLNEQMATVRDLSEQAAELDQTIEKKGYVNSLAQLIDEAEQTVEQPGALLELAEKISDDYDALNKAVSQLALTTANADDILKQIVKQTEAIKKRLSGLEKDRDKGEDDLLNLLEEKQAAGDEKTDARSLRKALTALEDKIEESRTDIDTLLEHSGAWMDELQTVFARIGKLAEKVEKAKDEYDYTDEQLEAILKALDVAAPGKRVKKQLSDLQQQMDEDDLHVQAKEQLKQLQQLVEEATEAEDDETLEGLTEEIETLNRELESDLARADEIQKQLAETLGKVEETLAALTEEANMPERLAEEYDTAPLAAGAVHDYRAGVKEDVEKWQKQLSQMNKGLDKRRDQFDALNTQLQDVQQAIVSLMESMQSSDAAGDETADDDARSPPLDSE